MRRGVRYHPCPQDARRGRTRRHPTLNQLNESIAAGDENIRNRNWKYRAEDGIDPPRSVIYGGKTRH